MYYLYDKDSMEYTHATGVKPDNDFYTTLAPLHPDDEITFHTRIYQPETDDWLQIDKTEYSKMTQPSADSQFQIEIMTKLAELRMKLEEANVHQD